MKGGRAGGRTCRRGMDWMWILVLLLVVFTYIHSCCIIIVHSMPSISRRVFLDLTYWV